MSSAAVQQSTLQPQYNDRYAANVAANFSSSPPSSRQPTGKRPSGNAAAAAVINTTPQQVQYSSPLSSPPMTTPRGQPTMPSPSSHASPSEPLSSSTYRQFYPDSASPGPAAALPIRTSSHQAPTGYEASSIERENDRKQRSQKSPRDDPGSSSSAGKGQRSRQAPTQSRSATAVGQPPVDTSLPRENSAIITHIVVDDPQADLARERARVAEALPNQDGAMPAMVDQTVPADPDQKQRSRQEHLKQQSHRKEVKFGDYILGQTLGEGEFGKVKMGWKKDSSVQVAIKLIRKESLQNNANRLPKIYREISILRELQHPNIVRLHEFVETERHMGIILEYASGGELFDFILNQRYLKDPQARRLFAQLVSGVGYLHKKGIVHRDLKLENLLLDRNRNIIITDFGFANTFNPEDDLGEEIEHRITDKDFVKREKLGEPNAEGMRRGDLMQTSCGSPCYAAPELVVSDGLYTGRKVDVWSCGVILYAMLAGYLPFDDDPANPEGDNINLLYKYIVSTPLTFPEYVTPHARDLLRRILVPDPRRRADLFEVARHSWLSEYSHVVGFIGSSTKSDVDIAASAMRQGEESALLGRSASVREPASKSPTSVGGIQKLPAKAEDAQADARAAGPVRDAKRRTVQVEYVAPKDATARAAESSPQAAAPAPVVPTGAGKTKARGDASRPIEVQSPLRAAEVVRKEVPPAAAAAQAMPPPPARPARDQRAVSDNPPTTTTTQQPSASRPGTSGSRGLTSRGNSYSQPAVATSTNANAQAQLSQPKPGSGYIITGPMQQSEQQQQQGTGSSSRPISQQNLAQFQQQEQLQQQRGHKRSSTLSSIGDRILGRSSSRRSSSQQQQQDAAAVSSNEKKVRKYPPLSMKNAMPNINNEHEVQPRPSTESANRTSFGFSRKSSDNPSETKRSSRRSWFLPTGMGSFTGGGGGNKKDQASSAYGSRDGRPPSKGGVGVLAFGQGASRTPSESTNSTIPMFYDAEREAARQQRRTGAGAGAAPTTQEQQQQQQMAAYSNDKALPEPPTSQTPTQQSYSSQPIPQAYSRLANPSYPTPPPPPPQSPTTTTTNNNTTTQRKQYRDDGYGNISVFPDQSHLQQDPVERFYTPTGELSNNQTQSPVDSSQQQQQQQKNYGYTTTANAGRTQYAQAQYADDYGNNEYDYSGGGAQEPEGQRPQQQIRPSQRNLAAEQYERGNSGSSSATRRVMDFFRRRGKDRGEV